MVSVAHSSNVPAPAASAPAASASATALPVPSGNLVALVAKSMRTIAQHYAAALAEPQLTSDMLLGLLYLGQGAIRSTFTADLSFAVLDSSAVLHQLLAAQLVAIENQVASEQPASFEQQPEADPLVRPTRAARQLFQRLSQIAQQENARWRNELTGSPLDTVLLDEFLTMLQSTSDHQGLNSWKSNAG